MKYTIFLVGAAFLAAFSFLGSMANAQALSNAGPQSYAVAYTSSAPVQVTSERLGIWKWLTIRAVGDAAYVKLINGSGITNSFTTAVGTTVLNYTKENGVLNAFYFQAVTSNGTAFVIGE